MADLLLSYYGDDFTGSTDALEALSLAGVRTVLFLKPPAPGALEDFPGVRAVGLAGTGRTFTPAEMDESFPPLFAQLKALGARVTHYKVCSTFDSSPDVGSIGRAAELGREVFRAPFVPLLVGVPRHGRYCVFGNLFARSGPEGEPFRLDRHPAMSRHPVTPMLEADLRLHLAAQTSKRVALFDSLQYTDSKAAPKGELSVRLTALLQGGAELVLFDVLYEHQLAPIGRLIWERSSQAAPLFAVGSSGIEYALAAHWREEGLLDDQFNDQPLLSPLAPASQVLAISGSCSPVTARQIDEAARNGFALISLETPLLIDPERSEGARGAAVAKALGFLRAGRSVILHSCLGPEDARVGATARAFAALGYAPHEVRLKSGKLLGIGLGRTLRVLLEESGVRRVVVAGGDSSGYIASELGITALTMAAPLAPGAPLCRAHAPGSALHGLEMAFKGGQVGKPDFFVTALHGRVPFTSSTVHIK